MVTLGRMYEVPALGRPGRTRGGVLSCQSYEGAHGVSARALQLIYCRIGEISRLSMSER